MAGLGDSVKTKASFGEFSRKPTIRAVYLIDLAAEYRHSKQTQEVPSLGRVFACPVNPATH